MTNKEYYQANKEKYKEAKARFVKANPERIKEYNRKYYIKNKNIDLQIKRTRARLEKLLKEQLEK